MFLKNTKVNQFWFGIFCLFALGIAGYTVFTFSVNMLAALFVGVGLFVLFHVIRYIIFEDE